MDDIAHSATVAVLTILARYVQGKISTQPLKLQFKNCTQTKQKYLKCLQYISMFVHTA